METEEQEQRTSLWARLLLWFKGAQTPPERLRFELPRKGDTDILLSESQKKKLQDAVDTSFYSSETSLYSRDTGFLTRSKKEAKEKDDVII